MQRGGQIDAGPDVGGTGHPSLVFTGSTGSGGATWLTAYDGTQSTPAPGPTFGAETPCADVWYRLVMTVDPTAPQVTGKVFTHSALLEPQIARWACRWARRWRISRERCRLA